MASIKISNLNQATAYTLNDVVAIVDSGSTATKKINISDLLRNTDNIVESTTNTNAIAIATNAGSANFQVLRGTNNTTAVIAATDSYINQGQNHFIGGGNNVYINAAGGGHSAIIGSDSVSITGAYNHAIIGSYGGPNINGGEENVIAASEGSISVDGNRNMVASSSNSNISGGNRNFFGGTQSISISNGTNTIAGGVEGLTINGNPYKFAIFGGYGTNSWNVSDIINGFVGGFYNLKLDNGGATLREFGVMASRDDSMGHNYSAMVATSGRTSLYDHTLHTDNLYAFERIQSATNVSTTISNEQFLTGGLGMVQYTDVSAGNLNLKINDVRNGEVYHWVIDNQTGGSISVNSTATNTGFTITDNTANQLSTGAHIFTIVIVNNKIIIEGTH